MLHDERRTGDYLAALAAAVRSDDVVLDIGTGSGVLALAAARAGARRVYAVEASDIAEVAEKVSGSTGEEIRSTLLPAGHALLSCPSGRTCSWRKSSAMSPWKRKSSRPRSMPAVGC